MFTNMKRFAAFLLALVMVFSLLPAGLVPVDAAEAPEEIADAAYAEADLVFNQLDAAEEEPAKKNKTTEEKVEDAIEIVVSSDSYVEDSLVRNGNSFTWWTDDGIQCVYSPRMREISEDLTPESGKNEIVNEPVPIKGGSPTGNQVYLIGPYYGHDSAFTNQYKNEAKRVAEAIGDTDGYTLYSGTSATVDKVAEAVANGAVVFFDSHGMTDYENPSNEWDCSTRATVSYLCLTSTTGLTSEDYNDGALYYSDGICINGAIIANHMKKNSPGGILWMAICLGMATNTICNPLREMGVEVVYGYSESVTFEGDYRFEETFWKAMLEGNTVAEAVASMKAKWGNYDWSTQIANDYGSYDGYTSVSEAQKDFSAFPVVVSDEDPHPGKRTTSSYGASTLQTVKSTYTLFTACDHVWASATCTAPATCTLCGRTTGKPMPHTDNNTDEICDACGKDISVVPNTYIKVTETPDDWAGQYLIVYEEGNLAFNGSLTSLDAVYNTISVTIEDGVIVLDEDVADSYFVIASVNGGYSIQAASGRYIGRSTNANGLDSGDSAYTNSLSVASDESVTICSSGSAYLRFNETQGQMRFRYYRSDTYSNQQPIALYKLAEGGTSAGCSHSYDSGVVTTAPTCTAAGEITYTCVLCSDTYTNSVPATGHTWGDATCMAPKTCAVCNATTGSTIDHADTNGDEACDFCGVDMSVPDTPAVPPVAGGNTYEKVTTAPSDWSGQYLLVYEDASVAFDGSLTKLDVVRNTISVTIDNNRITLDDINADSYITITRVSGGYAIQTASGYYIGNTSNSNKLLSSTTTVYTNTLALESDGSARITSSGDAIMRFNGASDQMRFRYYKTSSYAGQKPVALYKLVEHTHDYVDGTCTGCGASEGPLVDANLKFMGDAGISFQDYIGMNIMFQNSKAKNYDSFYVVATQVAPDGTITESVCNAVPYSKSYTIFEHPVMAWSMTEQVTLTLYAKKGDVLYVGESRTASVESLALSKLATSAAAGKTLNCQTLVDMLNYGAQLQINQKHNVESLPSAGEYAIYATEAAPVLTATTTKTGDGEGFLNGPSISMQAKVEFNVMFKGVEMVWRTVKVYADGVELEDAVEFQAYSSYQIARIAIKATQMRSTFTIALYDDATGEAYTQVVETSVEALCLDNINAGKNIDLANALMRYGDSVAAYASANS